MAYASLLEDRSIGEVAGAEARDFLQGLVSGDVAATATAGAIYAALLTPQGKILFDFFVIAVGENRFLLDCAADRASDLLNRLKLYRLRAKIEIKPLPEFAVASIWGSSEPAPTAPDVLAFADPRLPALGTRLVGPRAALLRSIATATEGDYYAHRLNLGVPDSADLPPDQVYALDAGFEELHGVNFKKGCYVGQEVTARMKHRSTARRRFLIAEIVGETPPPGTPLLADGREVGHLAAGKNGIALALVRLDRVDEARAAGKDITAAGRSVALRKPTWLLI